MARAAVRTAGASAAGRAPSAVTTMETAATTRSSRVGDRCGHRDGVVGDGASADGVPVAAYVGEHPPQGGRVGDGPSV